MLDTVYRVQMKASAENCAQAGRGLPDFWQGAIGMGGANDDKY